MEKGRDTYGEDIPKIFYKIIIYIIFITFTVFISKFLYKIFKDI